MAWTKTDLDKIETALATGARRVRLNGREYEYHSVNDMLKARDAIRTGLNTALSDAGGVKRPTAFRTRTSKGL